MSHSEICPVCNGKETIDDPDCAASFKQCHGCYGRGWIIIYEPAIQFMQPYPYIVYGNPVKDDQPGTTWTGYAGDKLYRDYDGAVWSTEGHVTETYKIKVN